MTTPLIKHGTLSGTTVATVTVFPCNFVEICNWGTADIYAAAVSGSAPTDPTVAGDDCDRIPPNSCLEISVSGPSGSDVQVKLLGSGNDYTVAARR